MKHRSRAAILLTAAVCVLALLLAGCGGVQKQGEGSMQTYYLNADATALVTAGFEPETNDTEQLIGVFLGKMTDAGTETGRIPLLPETVVLEKTEFSKPLLSLYFSDAYAKMEPAREVLARAGLVRMFTQIEEVNRVAIYVGNEPLHDRNGKEIGAMRRESFIDNSAQMLNNYEQDAVRLYFANASGDRLVEEPRAIYHSSSQPLEWAVVARLVGGPQSTNAHAVLPADLEILSVSTAQEICYVNLGRNFLTSTLDIAPEIPVYAIVNSLVESCNVKQVQIAVEGDIKVVFKDTMDLNQLYEEDLSFVEDAS